jgi:hypothetical protein
LSHRTHDISLRSQRGFRSSRATISFWTSVAPS